MTIFEVAVRTGIETAVQHVAAMRPGLAARFPILAADGRTWVVEVSLCEPEPTWISWRDPEWWDEHQDDWDDDHES